LITGITKRRGSYCVGFCSGEPPVSLCTVLYSGEPPVSLCTVLLWQAICEPLHSEYKFILLKLFLWHLFVEGVDMQH